MQIVHVIWSLNIGGAETMLVNLVNEQARLGEKITLIIINNSYDNGLINAIDKSVNVIYINRRVGSKSPFPILRLNLLLYKINPAVIHCHVGSIIDYLIKSLHKRTVLTMHTTGIVTAKNTLKKYARVFAISDSVKDVLKEKYDINAVTIMNGVVFDKIKRTQSNETKDCFKIVNVGRLVDNIKGQSVLVKAIGLLAKQVKVSVDIMGDGPDYNLLDSLRKELNIESQVNLLGAQSQDYIHNNLCSYDLLIQPSFIEGFGLTIVEAMAAKIPVLVSDIDGTTEVIKHGEYGLTFKVGNPNDLANQIQEVINNRQKFQDIADKAYLYAKENYSLSRTASEYITSYKLI